jgi:hypothetical protein
MQWYGSYTKGGMSSMGMSHVNDHPIADAAYAPFGGERNS